MSSTMKLAINGGKPVRKTPLATPPLGGEEELDAVRRAFDGPSLNYGIGVGVDKPGRYYFGRDFEEQFAAYHGAKHAILTSNGTVAITLALRAVGVDWGDEVIFQPYTCFANVEAAVQAGAVPVFVDIDPDTYCLDGRKVEEKIGARTKAIVAIHWGGRPADLDALRRIARRHGVALIEDAAVAMGAEWKGKKVGAMGQLGAFSFGWGKPMQCGEAGAVVTNSKALAEKCHHLRNRGRNLKGDAYTIGWNCRVSEILSAVLIAKLEKYPAELERRVGNVEYLKAALSRISGIELLPDDSRVTRNAYCFFIFKLKSRDLGASRERFIEAVGAEGISLGGPGYPEPVYRNAFFTRGVLSRHFSHLRKYRPRKDYGRADYPESERAYRSEAVWLPHGYLGGTKADMDDIIAAITKVRENVHGLH